MMPTPDSRHPARSNQVGQQLSCGLLPKVRCVRRIATPKQLDGFWDYLGKFASFVMDLTQTSASSP
jgi:hypothetical protein